MHKQFAQSVGDRRRIYLIVISETNYNQRIKYNETLEQLGVSL